MINNSEPYIAPPEWEVKGICLGQTILKTKVPLDVFNAINYIFENKYEELPNASPVLVGKIKTEKSLFSNNNTLTEGPHNFLPIIVTEYLKKIVEIYLKWNQADVLSTDLNSVWINEMTANEYNPIHVHKGNIATGLSSVMGLKIPDSYGEEVSYKSNPLNGELQLLGNSTGQFSTVDYSPFLKERDFIVFPYDIRHTVYPFNGDGHRRTLAANIDVDYNSLSSRGTTRGLPL